MTVLWRLLLFVSLLVMVTGCMHGQMGAQLPSERVTKRWLTSGEPRLAAWGARTTLASHHEALIPDLFALVAEWQALPGNENGTTQTQDQLDQRDARARFSMRRVRQRLPAGAASGVRLRR